MAKKMNLFEISEYLKGLGFDMVGRNDNSKVLYFKHKDVDVLKMKNPEKDYCLVMHPTFDNGGIIVYGQYYSFMGFLPNVTGAFTSPTFHNTLEYLDSSAIGYEENFKKVLNAMTSN